MQKAKEFDADNSGLSFSINTAEKLKISQQTWLKYLAAECDSEGESYSGGTFQPIAIDDCYFTLTNSRIEQLKRNMLT